MRREDVTFYSNGLRISAIFHAADTPEASAIVFCPGARVTKRTPYYHEYIPRLVDAGFSVLIFDYRGWGDSEGVPGTLHPWEQVADIRNAVTYLAHRPEVDPNRIGLFGVSMGGALAMTAAALDERIRAVAAVLSPMDGQRLLRDTRREQEWVQLQMKIAADRESRVLTGKGEAIPDLTPPIPERDLTPALNRDSAPPIPLACIEEIAEFRPVELVDRISPRASLWITATMDPVCPADHSRSAYRAAGPPKRLVEIPSASHYNTYIEHMDTILLESTNWFRAHLAPSRIRALEE